VSNLSDSVDPADDGSSSKVPATTGYSSKVPADDGFSLVAGDGVGSSNSDAGKSPCSAEGEGSAAGVAGEGSMFASPDPSFHVTSDQARWVSETALPDSLSFPAVMAPPRWVSVSDLAEESSSLADECSSMSECSSSSDISDECSSPGFAEIEFIGDVTMTKSLAVSARKDSQAWFFGWLRASVQHDEKLLAKLDVIVERTSRAKLDALSPDRSIEMLQMREKLASMDVERGQALATTWLSVQDEE
jgi:hypothetical protein